MPARRSQAAADAADRRRAARVISRTGPPPSWTHTSAVASSVPWRSACWAQFSRAPLNQRACGIGSAVRTVVHGAENSTS